MADLQAVHTPHLIVLSAESSHGQRIDLRADHVVVGRGSSCDVRLDDPQVSRTHAELSHRGGRTYVDDLGSTGGTFVNDVAVTAPHELRTGDVITFATVRVRYEGSDSRTPSSPAGPAAPAAGSPPAGSVRYDVGDQQAGTINNVGRDQYTWQVQQILAQRDSFFREIAATKTRARWLVWTGLLLFVVGFGLFAAGVLGFITDVFSAIETGDTRPPDNLLGRDIAGVPSGLVGWAIAAVGALLMSVGGLLHVVATSRRKRVDRELPVPLPPGQVPSQQGAWT